MNAGGRLVAYGLYNRAYSTFRGRALYLEDLYVSVDCRRQGIAAGILRQIAVVRICLLAYCVRKELLLTWT